MEIKQLCDGMDKQLASKEMVREFDKAREQHPALKGFATVADVREFLERRDVSEEEQAQQDAVVLAMVTEAQTRRSSCWSALLLMSHFPWLWNTIRVQTRHLPPQMTEEELAFLVIETFLDVVDRFPDTKAKGDGVRDTLVTETRRLVQKQRRREKNRGDREVYVEPHEQERAEGKATLDEQPAVQKHQPLVDRKDVLAQLQHFLTDDELQLLTATFGKGRNVVVWAREQAANDDPEDFDRTCATLRKRRARLIELVRQQVEQLEAVVVELEEKGHGWAA